jgi:hypothetical protein
MPGAFLGILGAGSANEGWNMVRNARFWVWHNGGWVKLTMRPGQSIVLTSGGLNDEGYSYSRERFTFNGLTVVVEGVTHARDCDGRMDSYSEHYCGVDDLKAMEAEVDEYGERPARPHWELGSCFQRDEQAELAGY